MYVYIYILYTHQFFKILDIADDHVTDTSRNNPKSLDCQTFRFILMFKFTAPANNSSFEHLDYRWLTRKFKTKNIFPHNWHIFAKYKSARTVGAKGRVFPEALTQSALAKGGATWFAGKMHGTFIKHRNLQHFWAQTGSPNFSG